MKLDEEKNRLALVLGGFSHALDQVGWVGTMGAAKYTDNGWQSVANAEERYQSALLRHWVAYWGGEQIDPESGLSHLAHMAWNALAICELEQREAASEAAMKASIESSLTDVGRSFR